MNAPTRPPLPSAADIYREVIFPRAMQRTPVSDDYALGMTTREAVAKRVAFGFCLKLALHAAEQHRSEGASVLAALIDCRSAVAELLDPTDRDDAEAQAEEAAAELRHAVETLIDRWGLEA